jgi:SRSO17 transposase
VAPQYSGAAGGVANSQVGVFLAYAAPRGRAFLDRALYLPKEWTDDPARCRAAGVPAAVAFATKPELARALLARAYGAGTPAAWVTADAVYGQDGALRRWLEGEGRAYVLAVTGASRQWVDTDDLVGRVPIARVAKALPARRWRRIAVGDGTKGPRVFRWAAHEFGGGRPGWRKWVLFRRSVTDPSDIAYYRAFGPEGTTLEALARVAASRWAIEEGFERLTGDVGLDQYEVRRWAAWHRHVTLCLVAHAFLEVTRAQPTDPDEAAATDGGNGGAAACCR